MKKYVVAAIAVSLSAAVASQQPETGTSTVVESGGRIVTFTDAVPKEYTGYDSPWHYSHAIRAGDYVYISGVIIGADDEESLPISKDRFREHTENAFEALSRYVATAGASLEDVIKINTFHVLDGRNTELTIDEQALVIAETRAKYSVEPHSAWTAVGTSGLFSPRGIVEIEMVLYAPLNGNRNR